MTNKEVFEMLFDISMEQLREMPEDALIKWKNEINKVLWGGFNGGTIPSFQAEEGEA
jgi:hypothetical protein